MISYDAVFILTGLIGFICLMIEITLHESLEESSSKYIQSLQAPNTTSAESFFLFISYSTVGIAMGIGFVIYTYSHTKIGVICVLLTFFVTWLGDILKMTISHSRPFWKYDDILAMSCPKDFGAPSGHALTVGSLILYFYAILFKSSKVLTTLLAALLMGLLGLDRNYLGVHYYFQVVLGFALCSFFVTVFLSRKVLKSVKRFKNNLKLLLILESGCIAGLVLGIVIHFTRDPEFDDKWGENYKLKCNSKLTKEIASFSSLKESSCIMIISGFLLGIYLNNSSVLKTYKYYISAYSILIIGVLVEQGCEYLSKSLPATGEFVALCILRFLISLYIAMLIPWGLSFFFRNSNNLIINN
jgi:membrane-associated phospholipid phosphatase